MKNNNIPLEISSLVGNSFEEMSLEEMALTQGTGDVQPQSTPGCFFASLGIGVTISAWKC
ncbi:TPA: lichenicidin A2 family type 2 lantibiotic [Staphylococcus aureus]|nr:lichenicidin A2 family type 2 lantibiotic [Staphylococcus aureus]HDP4644713.1 lichenicidin A2 family type 2 lantibiotic [Staphylococcus aureus]HDP4652600.1 lichenicidin A2 family type 2 lantibiotic [Staphylococcus aureus]HDP4665817.1 lichenicidin A2 family type 2 lantibiotic [Staphylococcus aureus]HDP6317393.1 lichenicidin A2 family type 2 lantibiotic [Staphylococcus aureus]